MKCGRKGHTDIQKPLCCNPIWSQWMILNMSLGQAPAANREDPQHVASNKYITMGLSTCMVSMMTTKCHFYPWAATQWDTTNQKQEHHGDQGQVKDFTSAPPWDTIVASKFRWWTQEAFASQTQSTSTTNSSQLQAPCKKTKSLQQPKISQRHY